MQISLDAAGPTQPREARRLFLGRVTCNKIKLVIAATFLAVSVAALSIGIPKIIQYGSQTHISITEAFNIEDFTFNGEVQLDINRPELVRYLTVTIVGMSTAFLSLGIFCGMANINS